MPSRPTLIIDLRQVHLLRRRRDGLTTVAIAKEIGLCRAWVSKNLARAEQQLIHINTLAAAVSRGVHVLDALHGILSGGLRTPTALEVEKFQRDNPAITNTELAERLGLSREWFQKLLSQGRRERAILDAQADALDLPKGMMPQTGPVDGPTPSRRTKKYTDFVAALRKAGISNKVAITLAEVKVAGISHEELADRELISRSAITLRVHRGVRKARAAGVEVEHQTRIPAACPNPSERRNDVEATQ